MIIKPMLKKLSAVLVLCCMMLTSCAGAAKFGILSGYTLYENSLVVSYTNVGVKAYNYKNGTPTALAEKTINAMWGEYKISLRWFSNFDGDVCVTNPVGKAGQTLESSIVTPPHVSSAGTLVTHYSVGRRDDCVIIAAHLNGMPLVLRGDLTDTEGGVSFEKLEFPKGSLVYPLAVSNDGKYLLCADDSDNSLDIYDLTSDEFHREEFAYYNDVMSCSAEVDISGGFAVYNALLREVTLYESFENPSAQLSVSVSQALEDMKLSDKVYGDSRTLLGYENGYLKLFAPQPDGSLAPCSPSPSLAVQPAQLFALQFSTATSPDGSKTAFLMGNTFYIINRGTGEYTCYETADYSSVYNLADNIFSWIDDSTLIFNAGTTDSEGLPTISPNIIKLGDAQ